jgi:hypothetical protein
MSLDAIVSNLEYNFTEMSISHNRKQPILEAFMIHEIFVKDYDVYSADSDFKKFILDVPNLFGGRYYDNEDFIYSKLRLAEPPSADNATHNATHNDNDNLDDEYNYLAYLMENNLIISNVELDLNSKSVIAKILYIYQFVKSYYTSLRHLRPLERLDYLPSDLGLWIFNIVDTIRILLDRNLFNYTVNDTIPLEMFNEMINGLELITCHIRLIFNHIKTQGQSQGLKDCFKNGKIEEKHLTKIIRLVNNLCVIMIYFWKYL